ncbi:MAG: DUF1643 domain-containing protein [Nanoarchaeota archaeon]
MIQKSHISKDGTKSLARFSDCEKYRYTLNRTWDDSKGKILFIGLNPSTADEIKNDPTVTRMINFARKWGYGSVTICNLFSFRATFPDDLKKAPDPVGTETDFWLQHELVNAEKIIAAWGNHGAFNSRSQQVSKILPKNKTHVFGITKLNEPKHILYLSNSSTLKPLAKTA